MKTQLYHIQQLSYNKSKLWVCLINASPIVYYQLTVADMLVWQISTTDPNPKPYFFPIFAQKISVIANPYWK